MKHDLKFKKVIQYASFAFLLLAFVFTSVGVASAAQVQSKSVSQVAVSKYLEAQQNPNLSDKDKIKAAIDAYFTTRYEGQKLLQKQDFSPMLENRAQSWVVKEEDKRDVELYVAKLFSLRYLSYQYTLNYRVIKIIGNKATVQLREGHKVVFEAIAPKVSELANLQHTFTLHHKKGVWVIDKDVYQDEYSQLVASKTKANIKKQIDENYQLYQSPNRSVSRFGRKGLASFSPNSFNLTAASYNRTQAVNYSAAWALGTNSNYSPRQAGGDCASFVSQAIYAGMGYNPTYVQTGMSVIQDTGWYYDFPTDTASPAWAGVPQQYTFIVTTNKAGGSLKGPYGSAVSLCKVSAGDVVQIDQNQGLGYDHEGMIAYAPTPKPACGSERLSMYTLNAHDSDRLGYSLASWAAFKLRYIQIAGYNK